MIIALLIVVGYGVYHLVSHSSPSHAKASPPAATHHASAPPASPPPAASPTGPAASSVTIQLTAVEALIDEYDLPDGVGPHALLLTMTGVAQVIGLERTLGLSAGHDETLRSVDHFLTALEQARTARAADRPAASAR